ncbi:Wzz/FepE/Etk N-terminal domain-containing protein, partial [Mesorhizobium sp.]|uniref:GumC family protein n=1 Tax=Mesorhizobium sp. TaxID=1871066 RepID=UPI0025E1D056
FCRMIEMVNQIQLLRPKQAPAHAHEASVKLRRPILEEADSATPFQQMVITVWRRKWLVIGMSVLGGALAGFIGLMRPPLYEASTQMIVALPGSSTPAGAAAASQDSLAAIVDGHLTVLSSEGNLRNVLAALRKADADQPPAPPQSAPRRIVGAIAQKARTWASGLLSLIISDQQDAVASSETKDAADLRALHDELRVGQELRSRIISIGFTDRNPVRAAQVANAVAAVYVDGLTQQSRASDQQELTSIVARLPETKDELAQATAQLQAYRFDNGAPGPGSVDDNGREIADIGRQMSLAKTSLADVETRLERISSLRDSNAPAADMAAAIGQAAPIGPSAGTGTPVTGESNLNGRGPATEEIDREVARLEAERQVYQRQVASLQQQGAALKAASADAANRLSGLRALELKAEVISQRYNYLLGRQQDLEQRIESPQADVAILSQAMPPTRPITQPAIFLLPPGMIVFGLGTAVLLLARRRFDRTLRSQAEAEAALGITCSGLIPKIARPSARRLCSLLLGQHKALYTCAVGSLLMNLANARLRLPGVILIMPSDEGEDKTLLAWSLALTATRLGEQVLLVDFDQQETRITREFRNEFSTSRINGSVADFLIDNRSLAETVEEMTEIQVGFMPAPPVSRDLLHLIAMVDGTKIVDKLREKYSLVILNGPSGAAGPEARLLTSWADAVLLTVRWGATPRNIARSVLEFIGVEEKLPWNLPASPSSVLTQVDLKQHASYRFGDSGDLLLRGL